jgi:hypothetical protein
MRRLVVGGLTIGAAVALFATLGVPGEAGNRAARCPTALVAGPGAAKGVLSAVARSVPYLYSQPEYKPYEVTAIASLRPKAFVPAGVPAWGGIAVHRCGARVAARSWIVFLYFPKLASSPSLYEGIVFAARTPSGWRVWYRYR